MVELRAAFMGTPRFALPVLSAMEDSECQIAAVYTAPDRPAGRGRRVTASPVKEFAEERGWPVFTPEKLTPEEVGRAEALNLDVVVVAAYGLLLPGRFLAAPRLGCVNVHPSLLPRYRGASPVVAAILAGDAETGTTLMVLDPGMDTGPILTQERLPLDGTERAGELTERLFAKGADMLRRDLQRYAAGTLAPSPQPAAGVIVTRRVSKADGEIDWAQDAVTIDRQVRAYDPWPRARSRWKGFALEIVACSVIDTLPSAVPGVVLAPDGDHVVVAAGRGALLLERVKLEGKKEVPAPEFARGHRDFVGSTLPS